MSQKTEHMSSSATLKPEKVLRDSSEKQEFVGIKEFDSEGYGTVQACEIKLNNPNAEPGTMGWATRFSIVTTGKCAEKWPSINAWYVKGILDLNGNWIADFKEPTENNPTIF